MKSQRDRHAYVVGVDLGGSNLRLALVAPGGRIIGRQRAETSHDRSVEGVLGNVVGLTQRLMSEAEATGGRVGAVALGVPGLVTPGTGCVVSSPNLPGWKNVALRAELENRLQLPVHVENDVNAIAVGELTFGAARGARDALIVTLGTGVGGGLVLGGHLRRGPDGTAAEVGHMNVVPGGRVCGCGNRGCLESYSSATAIAARGVERRVFEEREATAEQLASLAREGNSRARAVFRDAGRCLGIVLASVTNLLNLEVVVIGGGVSRSWDLMESATREQIRRRAFAVPALRMKIAVTELLDDAGVLGAAYLARQAALGRL